MCFDEFRIRFRIFRTLVRRFFTPRDSFFFNSIVFDIWYIARNAEILGEIAERAPERVSMVNFAFGMIWLCRIG